MSTREHHRDRASEPRSVPLSEAQETDDQALVQALLAGSGESWEHFVSRYSGFVAAIVRRLLKTHGASPSNADIEDVVENVFVSLMEKDARLLRRYDPNHKLSTYLGVIARTQSHRFLRKRKPVASLSSDLVSVIADSGADDSVGSLTRAEAFSAVRLAIAAMGEREQRVLKLFYFESADYQTIAAEMGIKVNSVGALLTRSRARFEQELKRVSDLSESDYRAI